MQQITDKQAMSALESLDDCARMDVGVAPTGPYETLRKFILQHATTEGLADMKRGELESRPDHDMAHHWIDRYAAGIDDELQMDRVCEALGCIAPKTS